MGLTLYPAIDLKAGQVVRLKRGDMAQATIYNADPAAQAADFARAGFAWVHVVDLDGAFAGRPANVAAVQAIIAAVPGLSVQLGGGIRDMATAEAWLAAGVTRIILGSAAVKDPDFARAACRAFPGRVALGIDARDGFVATEGWAGFAESGACAIIYTDIARDGMLTGVNVAATAALARAVPIPVIASGGVASIDDIVALKADGVVAGAILGRALYDGRVDPAEALQLAA